MRAIIPSSGYPAIACLLALAAAFLAPCLAHAGPPPVEGVFVTVRAINSEETERIDNLTRAAVERFRTDAAARPADQKPTMKIVFDFNPDSRPSSSGSFGVCYDLAHVIRALRQDGVATIAFVHAEVTRHSVLPVLACQEIVMSDGGVDENGRPLPEGQLGDVSADADEALFYRRLIQQRPHASRAVALKLLDKDLRLRRVRRDGEQNVFYVITSQVRDARYGGPLSAVLALVGATPWEAPEATLVRGALLARAVRDPFPGLLISMDGATVNGWPMDEGPLDPAEPGTARLRATRAYEFGLCSRIAHTRQEVKDAYQMPPTSLREDPLLGRTPRAYRLDVSGTFTAAAYQSMQRRIRRAVGKGANLIILTLDCTGSDAEEALKGAQFLHQLKDDRNEESITTVAYLPRDATDAAAVLAMGCSQIVMNRSAHFGDFQRLLSDDAERDEMRLVRPLCALAREQGYPEALIRALLDRNAALYSAVNQQSRQYEWRLISQKDLGPDRWRIEEEIKKPGEPLVLSADRARALTLASQVVDGEPNDLTPVYGLYGLKASQVQTARSDWLDGIWEFLRHPVVSLLLVMAGVTGLILELKIPGVTLPGIVAAICFVLFFWSYSQLGGQFTWLAILLFVLGVLLVGLEIFVLPGFTLPGISGALLILVSLALVTIDRMPQTTHEWLDFGTTLTTFGLGLVGAVVCALFIAWYLPNIPYANRLVLKPQGDAAEDGLPPIPPQTAALLGAIGVAATPLRPAGKVQFGDEFVDVMAEGSYVVPGTRVQVVEIEGNRVVVKEV